MIDQYSSDVTSTSSGEFLNHWLSVLGLFSVALKIF